MIALCLATRASIFSVLRKVENHWSSANSVAEPFFAQLPVGTVYQCSESPFICFVAVAISSSVQR